MSDTINCPHCNVPIPTPARKPSATTQKKLGRLAKERPDLLAQVERGELSVTGATVLAGWVPRRTPFDEAVKLSIRMSDEDLFAFSEWLTSDDYRDARAKRVQPTKE